MDSRCLVCFLWSCFVFFPLVSATDVTICHRILSRGWLDTTQTSYTVVSLQWTLYSISVTSLSVTEISYPLWKWSVILSSELHYDELNGSSPTSAWLAKQEVPMVGAFWNGENHWDLMDFDRGWGWEVCFFPASHSSCLRAAKVQRLLVISGFSDRSYQQSRCCQEAINSGSIRERGEWANFTSQHSLKARRVAHYVLWTRSKWEIQKFNQNLN